MAGELIFLCCMYFVVPSAIAALVLRAGPIEIVHAYIAFFGILIGLGMLWGSTWGEKIGWPMIIGMFLATPGIPAVIFTLRLTGLRLPFLKY